MVKLEQLEPNVENTYMHVCVVLEQVFYQHAPFSLEGTMEEAGHVDRVQGETVVVLQIRMGRFLKVRV